MKSLSLLTGVLIPMLAILSSAGCFNSPDMNNLKCTTSARCPTGNTCVVPAGKSEGRCERLVDSGSAGDAASVVDGAASVDGSLRVDVALAIDGASLADGIEPPFDGFAQALDGSVAVDLAPLSDSTSFPDVVPDKPSVPDLGPDVAADIGAIPMPDAPPDRTPDTPNDSLFIFPDTPPPSPDLGPDLPPSPDLGPDLPSTKPRGAACSLATECTDGFCADGYCCDSACTGTCMACSGAKTGGADGSCKYVKTGGPSDGDCTADAVNACGTDGTCNGSGTCRKRDGASVSCGTCGGTATCSNGASGTCSKSTTSFWWDGDHDGFGNPGLAPTVACSAPAGYVQNSSDCDDSNPAVVPGYVICGVTSDNTPAVLTCQNNGTYAKSPCASGCVNTQCRTFPTVSSSGTVTCGSTSCSTSVGCSLPENQASPPTCGTTSAVTALCDGPNDCPTGQLCCHSVVGSGFAPDGSTSQYCTDSYGSPLCLTSPGSAVTTVCDPSQSTPCPSGMTCTQLTGSSPLSSYICI